MISIDDPSFAKDSTCAKATADTLEDKPSPAKKYKRFIVLTSLILLTGIFYVSQVGISAFARSDMTISDEAQKYYVCVLQKALTTDEQWSDNQAIVGTDADCLPQNQDAQSQQEIFTEALRAILADHPMEDMAETIAAQDRTVAALLVGIGKKESNWGKRSPSKGGVDCYNYWGYKTSGSRGQALGHACFGSPQEAVEVVGKRLSHFVYDTGRDTPAKMIIWKCGSSCAGHSSYSVQKWISDVTLYYNKVIALDVPETKEGTQSRFVSLER